MAKRPNILFLWTDEQRPDTIRPKEDRPTDMPNLLALAERSCEFEQAFCTQPVCTPSRGSIMTGLNPHAHGAVFNNLALPEEVPCFPELLTAEARKAYTTGYFGKWHLGDEIFRQHGFEHWISIEDSYNNWYRPDKDRNAVSDYNRWLRKNGFKPDVGNQFSRDRATVLPEAFGKPAFLANETCRFIQENTDNPFILHVNFLEPHMPFFGPRSGMYKPEEVELPENYGRPPADHHIRSQLGFERWRRDGFEWYDLSSEIGWKQMTAAYRGLCNLIDHQTGRILETLESCGLMDDTIIVFTSDHGEMMGSHALLGKGVMYQESIGVPLLLKLPGQREGKRVQGPASQIDLVPTLLDLIGVEPPQSLHGRSLAKDLEADSPCLKEDVFVSWNHREIEGNEGIDGEAEEWALEIAGSAANIEAAAKEKIRTIVSPDGWRFSYSPILKQHELFNLREDPLEIKNLAADPAQKSRIKDLAGRIRKWQERVDDSVPIEL